jgi:hypothetical protein
LADESKRSGRSEAGSTGGQGSGSHERKRFG